MSSLGLEKRADTGGGAGRDPFTVPSGGLFPKPLEAFKEALASLDKSYQKAGKWHYFVPEPALVVGPTDEARRLRYVQNWCRISQVWLYAACHQGVGAIHQQLWRDFFNTTPDDQPADVSSQASQRKAAIGKILGTVFGDRDILISGREPATWHENPVDSLNDQQLCRGILWEMYEYGFRIEFLRLDEYLVPTPTTSTPAQKRTRTLERQEILGSVFHRSLFPQDLPTTLTGLAATHIEDRIVALESFRRVVCRWPEVPQVVSRSRFTPQMMSKDALELEKAVVSFYVQSFHKTAGCPPLIPHLFPL